VNRIAESKQSPLELGSVPPPSRSTRFFFFCVFVLGSCLCPPLPARPPDYCVRTPAGLAPFAPSSCSPRACGLCQIFLIEPSKNTAKSLPRPGTKATSKPPVPAGHGISRVRRNDAFCRVGFEVRPPPPRPPVNRAFARPRLWFGIGRPVYRPPAPSVIYYRLLGWFFSLPSPFAQAPPGQLPFIVFSIRMLNLSQGPVPLCHPRPSPPLSFPLSPTLWPLRLVVPMEVYRGRRLWVRYLASLHLPPSTRERIWGPEICSWCAFVRPCSGDLPPLLSSEPFWPAWVFEKNPLSAEESACAAQDNHGKREMSAVRARSVPT